MSKRISEFGVRPEQLEKLNSILFQENFGKRIDEVRKANVTLSQKPVESDIQVPDIVSSDNSILNLVEDISCYDLDPKNGNEKSKKIGFSGYDESKYKFLTLEGVANVTTHSLVTYIDKDIFPISKLTFYFYTRSNKLMNISEFMKYSEDPESDANRNYAEDRSLFIETYGINNTVLFIDGPMIGGNMTSYTIKLVEYLHEQNIVPIFIVKNSGSNLVVDNIKQLRNEFNSDLHWAYRFLHKAQRSNLFKYTDIYNPKNTKIFCYIKPFDSVTTQRIEFHPETYNLFQDSFKDIFDLIYYLVLVQGDKADPQIRPIAIAEKYARETMHLIDTDTLLRSSSLIPILNETR